MKYDVIVVGAGMAGLIAAIRVAQGGKRVMVISQGHGATGLTAGTVDLLGSLPWDTNKNLTRVGEHLPLLVENQREHPYSKVGLAKIAESFNYFKELSQEMDYPLLGDSETNYLLPTYLGAARPTALAPQSMVEGDLRLAGDTLVVGVEQITSFYPKLLVNGINSLKQRLLIPGKWHFVGTISLPGASGNPLQFASWLEDQINLKLFIASLQELIKAYGQSFSRLGLPAVLGNKSHAHVFNQLTSALGCPVFEVPVGQPTVPGTRLANILFAKLKKLGGRLQLGAEVLDITDGGSLGMAVMVNSPGRATTFLADQVVIATGGVYGKGLAVAEVGKEIKECLLQLPVTPLPNQKSRLALGKIVTNQPQPYATVGVAVNERLQPIGLGVSQELQEKVRVVGQTIGGYDPVVEKNGLGVALATGYLAGTELGGGE